MAFFITQTHGYDAGAGTLAQQVVANIAKEVGIQPLGIYAYDAKSDSDAELSKRLDGTLASVAWNDSVIIQSPTWNDNRYENVLINKLDLFRRYTNTKVIEFIHDILPLFYGGNQYLQPRLDLYKRADILMVPNHNTARKLEELGVTGKKFIYYEVFDNPTDMGFDGLPDFHPTVNFAGSAKKFSFVKDWNSSDVPLELFGPVSVENNGNVHYHGMVPANFIAHRLHEAGGFGLMWEASPTWYEYMKINSSFKFGTYLTAGLPVIVHRGVGQTEMVEKYDLGYAVDSLDEAVAKIKATTPEQYQQMAEQVEKMAQLTRNGYFIRRALVEAKYQAMLMALD